MKDCSPKHPLSQDGGSFLSHSKTMGSSKDARTPAQGHLKRQKRREREAVCHDTSQPSGDWAQPCSLAGLEKLDPKAPAQTPQKLAGFFSTRRSFTLQSSAAHPSLPLTLVLPYSCTFLCASHKFCTGRFENSIRIFWVSANLKATEFFHLI